MSHKIYTTESDNILTNNFDVLSCIDNLIGELYFDPGNYDVDNPSLLQFVVSAHVEGNDEGYGDCGSGHSGDQPYQVCSSSNMSSSEQNSCYDAASSVGAGDILSVSVTLRVRDWSYDSGEEIDSYSESESFEALPTFSLLLTPAYFGSADNPLIISSWGLTYTIPPFTEVEVLNSNNPNLQLGTNDVEHTVSITYDQAKALNGVGVLTRTITTVEDCYIVDESDNILEDEIYPEGQVNIYVVANKPVSIEVTGTDSNIYYSNRNNVFRTPSGLTYKAVMLDGTKITLSGTIYFPSHTVGNTYSPEQLQNVTVQAFLNYGGSSYTVTGIYTINYVGDTLLSVDITAARNFVYGNVLATDDIVVTGTFASGIVEEITSDKYTIKTPSDSTMIMYGDTITSITITYGEADFTDSSVSFTYVSPTIDTKTIVGNLPLAYNNKLSTLDLRLVKARITYTNSDYVLESSFGEYDVIAQYLDVDNDTWVNIFDSESDVNYNGSTPIEIDSLTNGTAQCRLVFTVEDILNDDEEETISVLFKVVGITEIKGISIRNPKTDYKVGDTFLNDQDNTEAVLYWEDSGTLYYTTIKLRDDYESISVFPQKGTEFKNIDNSKQITVKSILNSSVSAEYTIQVAPEKQLSNTVIKDLVVVAKQHVILPNGTVYSPAKGVLVLYNVNDTYINLAGARVLSNQNAKVYGYIDNIFDENIPAKVVLFDDYLPEIDGASNIEVIFPSFIEGEADFINNCSFGCLFGANNSVNRLFVSGNSEVPNADWHTAELNLTDYEGDIERINGNFSYIPSESIMYYGETDNKVIGYDIVSNDKLLVLKSKSDKEKTVYFRVPITVKAVDATGSVSTDMEGQALYQEEFGLVKGNNSVAGMSPTTILNFNGDTLFLDTDNHVAGLDLVGIIGDNQRYANSRSKLIDNALKDLDLSQASLWTNNKYLFLSIKNYGVFVTHFETKTETQYEWWFLSSHNPSVFIEIDDEIYFGNDDGNFCKMFNGTFKDVKKIFAGKEQVVLLSFNPEDERVLVDSEISGQLNTELKYRFLPIEDTTDFNKNIYFQVARIGDDYELEIDTENNVLNLMTAEVTIFADRDYYLNYIEEELGDQGSRTINCEVGSEFAEFGKKYRLVELDVDDESYREDVRSYRMYNEDGDEVDLSELYTAGLCEKLIREVDIADINKTDSTFKLQEDGKDLNLVVYGIQNPYERNIKAEIKEYKDIEAYYITAPFFANSLNMFKTIWQIVLTNDTSIPSTLQVGIASNKIPFYKSKTLARTSTGDLGINFADLMFGKTDLDKTVVPRTYNVSKVLGMQKFICFAFKNQKGNNAVLSEMAITYTLPFPSYGSD